MPFLSEREHLSFISIAIRKLDLLAIERSLIVYICILVYVIHFSEARSTCTEDGINYLCNNIASNADFPLVLPTNVQKVTLMGTNEIDNSFPDGLFNHQTWVNVSELFILEFTNVERIESGFLNGLEKLKFLSISSCTDLDLIDPDIFHSTPNLQALRLDGNKSLKLYIVEAALTDKLNNLKYLSLNEIQFYKRHVVLGDNFSKALHRKNLTYLDISQVNVIYVEHAMVQDLFANIKYLNFSYSTTVSRLGKKDFPISLIKDIELLDLTDSHNIMGDYMMEGEHLIEVADIPASVYVFIQGIVNPAAQLRFNVRFSFENCDIKFPKMIDLCKNSIRFLNITVVGACRLHALETLNLASNNMEYISPHFLNIFPSLKILNLSTNLLIKMQDMDDFSYLFSQNNDLEIVILHNNLLTFVPSNIFLSNSKLRILDLSENELSYLNIDLSNAVDLKLINLRKNRLKNLPATFWEQFEGLVWKQDTVSNERTAMTNILLKQFQDRSLIGKRYRYGYNASEDTQLEELHSDIPQYLMINIFENHFLCDCDTLVFMEWILFTDIDIVNRTALACKYGNKETLLSNELFKMIKENCRLPSIIGIGVGSLVALIISIITFAITIKRRHKSARLNKDLGNLKKEILRENAHLKFLVFLSYCSQDSQIVDENILPSLNRYISEMFNTERNLVCTGADSFVPGMRIIEEIHRCINECLVVVPVITPAFLQSHWSQEECVAAVDRHRHVVILMKQHTDTSRAIPTIKNLIMKYTRGTWSDNEGHFVIRPSWNTICEGIIRGASESFRRYWRQNVITPTEEHPMVEGMA